MSQYPRSGAAVQPKSALRLSSEDGDAAAVVRATQLAGNQRQALHATIHRSSLGAKAIADQAGVSHQFLCSCALDSTRDELPFRRLPAVLAACDDLTLVQLYADLQGALVLRRPRATGVPNVQATTATMRAFAALLDVVAASQADGVIAPRELAAIEQHGREAMEDVAQLLADYRARVTRPLLEEPR